MPEPDIVELQSAEVGIALGSGLTTSTIPQRVTQKKKLAVSKPRIMYPPESKRERRATSVKHRPAGETEEKAKTKTTSTIPPRRLALKQAPRVMTINRPTIKYRPKPAAPRLLHGIIAAAEKKAAAAAEKKAAAGGQHAQK